MPRYKVKYTFEVEVEAPNRGIAKIDADYYLDNRLWDYETHSEVTISTQELRQIFKNKLARAENSYQQLLEDDKYAMLASYAQDEIEMYEGTLVLIDDLEKKGITNV